MIKRILHRIGLFIEFSSFERRGIFALLFVLVLFLGYYLIRNNITYPSIKIDEVALATYQKELDEKLGDRPVYNEQNKRYVNNKSKYVALQLFNPNADNLEELISKGVPEKIAQNLVNYRSKGGAFRSKEDLAKLYSVSKEQYDKLEEYIVIVDTNNEEVESEYSSKQKAKIIPIDINTATIFDLKKVPGIGDVLSERVLKYRNQLGGFYELGQFEEVYGIPKEVLDVVSEYFTVDQTKLSKIKINEAQFKALLKHPYLDYQETKAIINYIEQHGAITSESEFKNLHVLKDKNVDRVLPYLDLN